jgi:hypothetical protein
VTMVMISIESSDAPVIFLPKIAMLYPLYFDDDTIWELYKSG